LKASSYPAINAQTIPTQILTTVYSQVFIHTASELEECRVNEHA